MSRNIYRTLLGFAAVLLMQGSLIQSAHATNNWNHIPASSACQGTNKTFAASLSFGQYWVYNSSSSAARSVVCTYYRDAHNLVTGTGDANMYATFYIGPGDTASCTWYIKNSDGSTYYSASDSYTNTTSSFVNQTIRALSMDDASFDTLKYYSAVCSIPTGSWLFGMLTIQDDNEPALN